MNVLLDFSAIRGGGGLQLAVNFLEQTQRVRPPADRIVVLSSDQPLLCELAAKPPIEASYVCPGAVARRLLFERVDLPRILGSHAIDAIYTFFGIGLPHPRPVVSIVTAAYPIICYPDSPYWSHRPWHERLRGQLRGVLRRTRLRRADVILVETEVMRTRLARSLRLPEQRFRLLAPAPSEYVTPLPPAGRDREWRVLFLSDLSPHKNLWRLYEVATLLETGAAFEDVAVRFLLSVSREQYLAALPGGKADERIVDKYFRFLGRLSPRAILGAYGEAHAIALLSDLESFSNNYMEAWKAGRPLIASDRDFARGICGDSALYVEPHAPASVAEGLASLARDPMLAERLVGAGKARLSGLPDTAQRTQRIWDEIEAAVR